MKRSLIAVLMIAVMLFAFAGVASAATDEEIATKRLMSVDVVTGDPSGELRLDDGITRAEFAAIAVRLRGMEDAAKSSKGATKFSDVKADAWYTGYINLASGNGIIKGDPTGTFRPNDQVNYAEAAAMLVRVLGYEPSIQAVGAGWPNNYLSKAGELGLLDNVKMADWKAPARRGDVFTMADNALDVDLMKQTSYGTDISYEEKEGETLLSEYLDVDVYDEDWADEVDEELPLVKKTPRVDIAGLEDNEVKLEGHTLGNTPYEVAEWINPDDFLGQHVEVWINDDDVVIYMEADDDEEVIVDVLDSNIGDEDANNIYLTNVDEDYLIDDNAIIYVDNVQKTREELFAEFSGRYEDAYVKAVLADNVMVDGNEEDDVIIFLDIKTYSEDDGVLATTYIVDEVDVDDEYIDLFALDGDDTSLDLEDEDYRIVKDGANATLEDIESKDVLVVFGNTEDETYYIEVFSTTVSGEVDDYYSENRTTLEDSKIEIDGEDYWFTNNVLFTSDDFDSNDDLDVDDVEDLVGSEVTVYLNQQGNIVAVASDEDVAGGSSEYGVIVSAATPEYRGSDYVLSIMNSEGKVIDFTFDPEDVEFTYYIDSDGDDKTVDLDEKVSTASGVTDKAKACVKAYVADNDLPDEFVSLLRKMVENVDAAGNLQPVAVKFDMDSDGDLKEIELLSPVRIDDKEVDSAWDGVWFEYGDPDYKTGGNSFDADELDEDDDVLYAGGKFYDLAKDLVIFDMTTPLVEMDYAGDTAYEVDDPDVTTWNSIEGEKLKFDYLVDDDEVVAIYITEFDGGNVTSDTMFAMVDGYKTVNGEDGTILLLPDGSKVAYENDAAERRAFIAYELDGDEIDTYEVLAYENKSWDEQKDSVAQAVYDAVVNGNNTGLEALDIDWIKYVLVDDDSDTMIEGYVSSTDTDTSSFKVESDAVRFFIDDGKIVDKADRNDFVLLIDTDDDGKAVDYEVGNIAKIGVKQAEAQAASKQASYIAAKNKYQNEIMAFNKLLGLPLDAKINLISGLELKGEDINLEAAISEAIEKDISVFSKREMLKVAEVSLEAAKKIYSPKVNTYKQMLYELEKSKIDLQEQEKELKMTIKETYLSLKALEGQYEALEKAVDAASEGYRLTKISYEVGIATQVELMQRAEELHQAETNLLNVLYNYNVLKAQFQNRIFLTSPGGTGGQNG